jgi:hypothetical protein
MFVVPFLLLASVRRVSQGGAQGLDEKVRRSIERQVIQSLKETVTAQPLFFLDKPERRAVVEFKNTTRGPVRLSVESVRFDGQLPIGWHPGPVGMIPAGGTQTVSLCFSHVIVKGLTKLEFSWKSADGVVRTSEVEGGLGAHRNPTARTVPFLNLVETVGFTPRVPTRLLKGMVLVRCEVVEVPLEGGDKPLLGMASRLSYRAGSKWVEVVEVSPYSTAGSPDSERVMSDYFGVVTSQRTVVSGDGSVTVGSEGLTGDEHQAVLQSLQSIRVKP